jgi:hypothetical protein
MVYGVYGSHICITDCGLMVSILVPIGFCYTERMG